MLQIMPATNQGASMQSLICFHYGPPFAFELIPFEILILCKCFNCTFFCFFFVVFFSSKFDSKFCKDEH